MVRKTTVEVKGTAKTSSSPTKNANSDQFDVASLLESMRNGIQENRMTLL